MIVEHQQELFQALFEAAQDAVLIADDERRFVDANPAAGELFGIRREELRGRRIEEFVEQVRGSSDVGEAWRHFQEAGLQVGECRLRRPDGTRRDLEYSAKTNFAPGFHLSILRDVTERKLAEEALACQAAELRQALMDLKESHWHLRKIQEVLPICMICAKVKTGESKWEDVVAYLRRNSLFLSHGYCPDCLAKEMETVRPIE